LSAVDILVNNAGLAPVTPIDEISLDEWQLVFDTNVRAAFLLSRLALGSMRPRNWGRIITMTSQAGITGGFFIGAHYSASKGALIALSRTLAKLGAAYGVTSNCIAPGLIDTDLVAGFPADRRNAMIGGIPMRRLGTIDEVGGLVGFLASDASSYVTGTTISVDGGLLAS
jgi:3-oxoacyl-[acyl-carrier protein] reductase